MSVIPKRRWLEKFTDTAGSNPVTFSRLEHDWTPNQALDVPLTPVAGADYGLNLLGLGRMPKRIATERVRFLLKHEAAPAELTPAETIDLQADRMRARLRRIGTGRLWALDDNGVRRWARAQIVAMPDFSFGPKNREYVPVSVEFARLSDWYAELETAVVEQVAATPTAFEADNVGTADVTAMTILFVSKGTNGFINPRLENETTGEWLQVNRTGSNSNHRIRIDTRRFRVERSTDGGNTWTDDYASLETGGTQAGLLTLAPGVNDLGYSQTSGTPNMTVDMRFHAPYE